MAKKRIHFRRYISEFSRPRGDNVRACARRLECLGLDVEILPHKASFAIRRPMSMSWAAFLAALRSVMDPVRGAVLLFSQATGNAFRCDNRGNRNSRFVCV